MESSWWFVSGQVLTGALHDNHRVMTVGERTFGKGVVQVLNSTNLNLLSRLIYCAIIFAENTGHADPSTY